MNPLSNPSYLLPPLIVTAVIFLLTIVVWRGTRRSLSSWLFCSLLLSVGLWGLLLFGMRSSPDVHRALLWDRVLPITTYATFVLYYHFTLIYSNTKGQRRIILTAYLLLPVFAVLTPTNLMIESMRWESYGYAPNLGTIAVILFATAPLLIAGGTYNLLKRYKVSDSYEERNRLLYLAIAALFPLLGAFLDGFTNLPPVAIWGNLAFCIMCSVAIVKYRLLDIRVVVRKSLAYLLISIVVAIPYVVALYLLLYIFALKLEPWWIHALIILLLAIALRPLYSLAQQLVDRLFYRERYDYLRALQRFSLEARSIRNTEELGSTLVELVSGALRSSSACLLLPSKGQGGLAVASCAGLDDPPSGVVLRDQGLLAKWLKVHGHILSSRELNIIPELQSLASTEKRKLEKFRTELYVPIKTREGELSGVLILGEKLGQQGYSVEDSQVLSTLAGQMATTLENAQLYSDTLRVRENLETWLNSMTDCVMIVNADYTIQFMNKAAIEKFGSRLGEKCWDALGKDTVCRPSCPVEHYLRGNSVEIGTGKRTEMHYRECIGDREYDIAAAPLLDPDGSLSIIEVLRDITESKRAEEREKELQKQLSLSSRLAAIGELAAGVAHEINNPLTGILGFSQRLLRKSTDEEVSQDLRTIHNEALRAARVVQNLLTFARRREPKKQYSDINDIVQEALDLRAYELKTSNIEVVTDLAPSLPEIAVDFYQIQEVFLNIILNAEQVMTEACSGGKLTIKTQEIKDYIKISFSDDGPGIPAKHLDNVFDPFFTTRSEKSGTGLGLSACHGIVTEHGGRIWVKSKSGKGATFFVELPMTTEKIDKNKVVEGEPVRRSK